MSTVSFREETIEREWFVVDLEGQTLGRAASRIAAVLRGKHKPTFTPNADCGDFVIVINADKVKLTSDKLQKKVYNWHTGYLGGIRSITAAELLENAVELLRAVPRGAADPDSVEVQRLALQAAERVERAYIQVSLLFM